VLYDRSRDEGRPIQTTIRSDAALIAASVTDPPAFASVFDRHWPRIHRYCVSRAGVAGEDIAAEVFRVAFTERHRYDPRYDDAAPWLYGIATNLLRRWFRSDARARRAAERVDRADGHDAVEELLDRVEAQRLGPALAAALARVGAADRDALLLHAWAGLTYEQIAQAMGVPVGTVRSRIHRARARLRAHLDPTPETTA
jgi:RNA polymerase sigma-70 factor (ECF subfamily)